MLYGCFFRNFCRLCTATRAKVSATMHRADRAATWTTFIHFVIILLIQDPIFALQMRTFLHRLVINDCFNPIHLCFFPVSLCTGRGRPEGGSSSTPDTGSLMDDVLHIHYSSLHTSRYEAEIFRLKLTISIKVRLHM